MGAEALGADPAGVVSGSYYYKRTVSNLYTVGLDTAAGWQPESDHPTTDAAAARVRYLNGASGVEVTTLALLERLVVGVEAIGEILETQFMRVEILE